MNVPHSYVSYAELVNRLEKLEKIVNDFMLVWSSSLSPNATHSQAHGPHQSMKRSRSRFPVSQDHTYPSYTLPIEWKKLECYERRFSSYRPCPGSLDLNGVELGSLSDDGRNRLSCRLKRDNVTHVFHIATHSEDVVSFVSVVTIHLYYPNVYVVIPPDLTGDSYIEKAVSCANTLDVEEWLLWAFVRDVKKNGIAARADVERVEASPEPYLLPCPRQKILLRILGPPECYIHLPSQLSRQAYEQLTQYLNDGMEMYFTVSMADENAIPSSYNRI